MFTFLIYVFYHTNVHNTVILSSRSAFQRALELDPSCIGALVGLAVLELNNKRVCHTCNYTIHMYIVKIKGGEASIHVY